jgi:hypothetical protein
MQYGEFYQHKDGGFYEVCFLGTNTVDGSEVVIYQHMYPFASGAKFVRPKTEWTPDRFRKVSPADYFAALMSGDREKHQAEITAAKRKRKYAECKHTSTYVSVSCSSYFTIQCRNCPHSETIDKD